MNEQFISSSALNAGNTNAENPSGAYGIVSSLTGMSNAEYATYSGLWVS